MLMQACKPAARLHGRSGPSPRCVVQTRNVACSAAPRPSEEPSKWSIFPTEYSQHAAVVAMTAIVATSLVAAPAMGVGMESVELPPLPKAPEFLSNIAEGQRKRLEEVEDNFQKSDTLKRLLEKSEANRAKNKKMVADKYCYRQAELGIGDCGGLRYIPGMTESGKQKTPEWLAKMLGVEVPEDAGEQKTLKDLFGGEVPK